MNAIIAHSPERDLSSRRTFASQLQQAQMVPEVIVCCLLIDSEGALRLRLALISPGLELDRSDEKQQKNLSLSVTRMVDGGPCAK